MRRPSQLDLCISKVEELNAAKVKSRIRSDSHTVCYDKRRRLWTELLS